MARIIIWSFSPPGVLLIALGARLIKTVGISMISGTMVRCYKAILKYKICFERRRAKSVVMLPVR